ncbi:AAA family ATPase [Hydrogenophaga electricum]|uniref:Endonuclease GajA/Old nuclease/RecF-like AAA domain-containing protein n=1 Tax=Hydrogenophaga electricum TaxID=1230953 RepID=A0ABQ6C2R9_9BURK|nr:AAA family ATPase [Hydrogenophaga electricum]GLS14160.1 hypothetical protein GCM10007935_15910 [Hydrogenophaga electricum]
MLESVLIQNFKGFKKTSIGPFRMVNLIIGGQNVGKTSLLEAVYAAALLKPHDSGPAFRPNEGADTSRYDTAFLDPQMFVCVLSGDRRGLALGARGRDHSSFPISMVGGVLYGEKSKVLKEAIQGWFIGGSDRWRCTAIPFYLPGQMRLVEIFGKVILARRKKALLTLLRAVDPRLESLDAIAPDGEQRVYAELDGLPQALPLSHLGHGFSRLVYLFSELLVSESEIALIDEIENGIHYSALPTLFKGIKTVALERQVQSLITTHSWDCLRAACEEFEDSPEMFQVIRLERHEDDVKAVCIDGERMLRLMAEEREVR